MKYILLKLLIAVIYLHPTYYPIRSSDCFKPESVDIKSYHIHTVIYFNNKEHVDSAFELREKFRKAFPNVKDCTEESGIFHSKVDCLIKPELEPFGPFLTGEWCIFALPQTVGMYAEWMFRHRGKHDVLVHPNTGCMLHDHREWAMWTGNAHVIDLTIFSQNTPWVWLPKKTLHMLNDKMLKSII